MALYPYDPENGQTDLMAAAYNCDADEIARPLSLPCDIDEQDCHGLTALMYAALKGCWRGVELLVENGTSLDLQSNQRWTALMFAVRAKNLKSVQALLKAGADPNVHDDYSTFETPLTLAALNGFFGAVKCLIAAGADPSIHGGPGQITAERIARDAKYHEISEFLRYNERKPAPRSDS